MIRWRRTKKERGGERKRIIGEKNEKTLEKIEKRSDEKNGRSTSHIREGGGGSITRNIKKGKNTKKGGCKKKEKEKCDARRLVYSL